MESPEAKAKRQADEVLRVQREQGKAAAQAHLAQMMRDILAGKQR